MKRWLIFAQLLVAGMVLTCVASASPQIFVSDIEQLYAAVNDAGNSGMQIALAPGVYSLSRFTPSNVERPNRGRLELQENMSLIGSVGDRSAVVIDATLLPQASYQGGGPPLTGAIRLGRGRNAIEWLTTRNATVGAAAIEADLVWPGVAEIRIASIASTGNIRGLDIRNFGPASSGETIDVEIVDSEFYNNTLGLGEGVRVGNFAGANGSTVNLRMSGNRSFGNDQGRLIVNNAANNCTINVFSNGNQFYNNGSGTNVLGGLGGTQPANGNTINYDSHGDRYLENTSFADFDLGGLVFVGGENINVPYNANNNTVIARLWGNRLLGNQVADLQAYGAKSLPTSVAIPGINNSVTVELRGMGARPFTELVVQSTPEEPTNSNTAAIYR
jgi:hypothetical protein